MKPVIRTPYFEIGFKNYLYGDEVLELALAAEAASVRYDVDILLITPYTEIRRVCECTERLIVLAPFMDTIRPGRGMACVLPEAIRAAGAKGVVVNHCERPLSLSAIRATIARANELDLLSFVCVDSIEEAMAVSHFRPDIINPEPSERIGTAALDNDMEFVRQSIQAIKSIDPNILVEQASGISEPEQVRELVLAGVEAVGSASGICTAPRPLEKMEALVRSLAEARQELRSIERRSEG